jgi:hypothetical protein
MEANTQTGAAGTQGPGSGGSSDTGDGASGATTNVWDYVKDATRGLLVLAALIYLTVFLVRHYAHVKDVTTVLGVVIPVLTAALGAAVGAAAGNATGQANKNEAVRQQRKKLANQLRPKLEHARSRVRQNISTPIKTQLANAAGTMNFTFAPEDQSQWLEIDASAIDETEQSLAEVDGILQAIQDE